MASHRLVWFLLVDDKGNPRTTATKVIIPSNSDIDDFRKKVKAEYADSHLKGIAPSDLQVYANMAALDAENPVPLEVDSTIGNYGGSKKDALLVVVPILEIPQVQPSQPSRGVVGNLLPFSDGINPLGMYFNRQSILDRMHQWITGVEGRNRFLLLNSPAASGKTSLLVLFQHKYQHDNLVIHYISLKEDSNPFNCLFNYGLDVRTRTCAFVNVIYLIDDAQIRYANGDFWSYLIKDVPLLFGPGVRFIISA
ncbi:hypothetical protein As57867_001798, partial [Aphanomyces stellatus]